MPSQAETIQALRKASNGQDLAVPPPKSPADVYAGAAPFAQALGLPDALKALRGQFTPEEAKTFALTSAMGLLPGAKAESAAAKTMGELLPHYYGGSAATSAFAKMTPKEYVAYMGESLPKQLPHDVEKVLAPHLPPPEEPYGPTELADQKPDPVSRGHDIWNSLSPKKQDYLLSNHPDTKMSELPDLVQRVQPKLDELEPPKSPAQLAKENNQIYPPITEGAINSALAKNPGASIFDVSGTHLGGESSSLPQSTSTGIEQSFPRSFFENIPREGGIQYTPIKASILGRSENLVHGTRALGNWQVPLKDDGSAAIGTMADALRLPDNELGVHFGNPKQANVFSGDWLSGHGAPRQYPVVVATNNPLELPDLGTWHHDNLVEALRDANRGELQGRAGYERDPKNMSWIRISPETVGQFPPEEVNKLKDIGDVRDYLSSKGYDSIKYVNKAEDPGNPSYIKFTGAPEAPDFVTGVRSPFAAFDPSKIMRPELALGIGGAAATPQIQGYIDALQGGKPQDQQDNGQQSQ